MLGDKGGRVKSYTMEPWPSYDMTSRTNNGNRTNEIENKSNFLVSKPMTNIAEPDT